jgi:hypothetical protein
MKKLLSLLLLFPVLFSFAQNVGIGITNPAFKLDVRTGSINTDSLFRINAFPVLSVRGNGSLFAGKNAGLLTTGFNNTFIGDSAGLNNLNGSGNTLLGFNTNMNSGLTNATAIGANAVVTTSNAVVLGSVAGVNGATTNATVGIGVTNPGYTLDVVSPIQNAARFGGPANMYVAFTENNAYRGYIGSYAGAAEDVDFGTGAGNATGKLHLTIQAVPKLTIDATGNIDIKGDLTNSTKTGTANLLPIAYGNISNTGFINAGSGNFTVTHFSTGTYIITITGAVYHFQQYVTTVTPVGSGAPTVATTGSGAGSLQVFINNLSGVNTDGQFMFVVYKQ